MIASFSAYDRSENQSAFDRLWDYIRDRLREMSVPAPQKLSRGPNAFGTEFWLAPDLAMSQTCGYPYRALLHSKVQLIGTPDFGVQDAPAGHYYSVFVASRQDHRENIKNFEGAKLAYNEALSQSGWAAPMNYSAAENLRLKTGLKTGAHLKSAMAVASGDAELASLDAVTWRLIKKHEPFAGQLKCVGRTAPATPGLPLVTSLSQDADMLFEIISNAIDRLSDPDKDATGLRGLVRIPAERYLAVPNPPPPMD